MGATAMYIIIFTFFKGMCIFKCQVQLCSISRGIAFKMGRIDPS